MQTGTANNNIFQQLFLVLVGGILIASMATVNTPDSIKLAALDKEASNHTSVAEVTIQDNETVAVN